MKTSKFAGICLISALSLCACKRGGGDTTDPKLPRPVRGAAGETPKPSGPIIDWSFLGAPNPTLVREQALFISPFAAGGNMVEEDPDIAVKQRGEAVLAWVDKHASIAAAGSAGVLRMTWTHCVGWGSNVPSSYTTFGCFTPLAVFVHPQGTPAFVKACEGCSREDAACVEAHCGLRLVEGYFTGKKRSERNDPEDAASARTSYEFRVLHDAAAGGSPVAPTDIDPSMELRLPAGSPQPEGAAIEDGPRFAVVASFDRVWAPTTRTLAQNLSDQLKKSGISDAPVIDSRRVRTQWCCSLLVIAARAATAEEAGRILIELTAKNLAKFEVIELY